MQAEVLVLLVALFMGPTNNEDSQYRMYIFEKPTFSGKEFCNQYVTENKNELYIYLSGQYNTLPNIYFSQFHCVPINELKKYLNPKLKKTFLYER